jgi:hypothetical protein
MKNVFVFGLFLALQPIAFLASAETVKLDVHINYEKAPKACAVVLKPSGIFNKTPMNDYLIVEDHEQCESFLNKEINQTMQFVLTETRNNFQGLKIVEARENSEGVGSFYNYEIPANAELEQCAQQQRQQLDKLFSDAKFIEAVNNPFIMDRLFNNTKYTITVVVRTAGTNVPRSHLTDVDFYPGLNGTIDNLETIKLFVRYENNACRVISKQTIGKKILELMAR